MNKKVIAFLSVLSLSLSIPIIPVNASKKDCTNLEKALVVNLRQQIFTLSNQLSTFKNSQLYSVDKYKSLGSLSSKSDMDYWSNQIKLIDKAIKNRENQISQITNKCNYSTMNNSSKNNQNLKNCTGAEKKVISSAISNFESIQLNKQTWDNKLEIAKSWAADSSKPTSIQLQASMDTIRYKDLYLQEVTKEQLATEQFNLLNDSCKNSGYKLPEPYLNIDQRVVAKNKASDAQIIDVTDESRDFSAGPFYLTRNEDTSLTINCTKSVWENVSLANMSLFLVGSIAKNPLYVEVFMKSNSPSNWMFSPLIKLQSTSKVGTNIGTRNFNGRFISSDSKSVCGLVTEKLGDLTKNFASDVVSVGLLLKTSNEYNSNSISSMHYSYMGGVLLPENVNITKPVYFAGYNKNMDGTVDIICGVSNYKDYDWSLSWVRGQQWSGTFGTLGTSTSIFKIKLEGRSDLTEYRGLNISKNSEDTPLLRQKIYCQFSLTNKAGKSIFEEYFGPLLIN